MVRLKYDGLYQAGIVGMQALRSGDVGQPRQSRTLRHARKRHGIPQEYPLPLLYPGGTLSGPPPPPPRWQHKLNEREHCMECVRKTLCR